MSRGLRILFRVWITASMNLRFSRLRTRNQELLVRRDFCLRVERNFRPPCCMRLEMLALGVALWYFWVMGFVLR